MNKKKVNKNIKNSSLYKQIGEMHYALDNELIRKFNRSLPLSEELTDRWKRAKKLGFGTKTSIYDSSHIFGKPVIGKHCWIGPFTIIDGSGGLTIGNFCTVSAGVHIYTHDNVKQTLSSGKIPIEREPVSIGNNVYIAPNAIITKGIKIGDNCIIGANAFVNTDIMANSIVFGQPAKITGKVIIENNRIKFHYYKK